MKPLLALAASVLALAASPAGAQDIVITNARVVLGDGSEPIENGTVVVRGGKVVAAGADVAAPGDIESMDAGGAWVTPGLFATVTTLGIWDVGAVGESNDQRAGGAPFSAALETAPIVNPEAQHVLVHRAAGITRAATSTLPSASIFSGQGAIIDLDSDRSPVMKANAFQMVELGERGGAIAGGSRAATHTLLRAALREASRDRRDTPRTQDIGRGGDVLLSSFDVEALRDVVTGAQPLYVHAERAADIRAALALKSEFADLDLVLVGASEGWLVADEIAQAGVPVIADGLDDLPSTFEQLAATQSNIGRMKRAGVTVAINASGLNHARRLTQVAGNLVALTKVPGASGLSWGEAFAAISSVPAEISGMGGMAGVLKAGALGDVVIWDGDPLEVGSIPTRVYIGGVEQPLENHQSRLLDRYDDGNEGSLPKAYDW
ncbi:amidohydrolase [Erythrobacter sp. HL-111]|uniref:amidohydrolase n=1 Tax=Erythrobacter sp. HL-111 TaxID=1798193 RepID=UPI0006D9A1DD|nr:amidohydrolase [Erythrobacter sp. HL-111]KPP94164.1 MAG: putative amidohydrolase [Erythrobacteraceae bacterium HL-111]SDS65757.1 Imidazolonepropionase [Erythrobacter sp. HL-111]